MTPIVVLSIHGGMLQDVFCNDRKLRAILVDWDTEGRLPDEPHLVEIGDTLGRSSLAYVAEYATAPLHGLEGDVASALAASGFAGDGELAESVAAVLGMNDGPAATDIEPTVIATAAVKASPRVALLRRLIAWYDDEDQGDGELERIVAAARMEVNRPE